MRAPVNSTYKTEYYNIVETFNGRNGTPATDAVSWNLIPNSNQTRISGDKELILEKREGFAQRSFAPTSTGVSRAYFLWGDVNALGVHVMVIGRDCFIYDVNTETLQATFTNMFTTTTGPVGITTFLNATNQVFLILTDGTTLNQVSTSYVLTVCVDADLPVPHLPQPIYIDGYLLLVKTNTGDCYNSDLNLPMSWTPGNFITSEISPDFIKAINKINNYFVLFGSDSIEFFYDAGNPTGTPFARNESYIKLSGYLGGLAKWGNALYFLAAPNNGAANLYKLEDFTLTLVGNQATEKYFKGLINFISLINAVIYSTNGTSLYVVSYSGLNNTIFYDLKSDFWGFLYFYGSAPLQVLGAGVSTGTLSYVMLAGDANHVYSVTGLTDIISGNSTPVIATAITNRIEFKTLNQKFISKLTLDINYTNVNGTSTDPSTVFVYWSDDDYRTFSTFRSIDLQQENPCVRQLGKSRKRAFKFTHADAQPWSVKGFYLDYNEGIK